MENIEYGAFVHRIVRAYSRRVADGDVQALAGLVGLTDEVTGCVGEAVNGLRALGCSWSEIAARLGITRSSAHERWGVLKPPVRVRPGGAGARVGGQLDLFVEDGSGVCGGVRR